MSLRIVGLIGLIAGVSGSAHAITCYEIVDTRDNTLYRAAFPPFPLNGPEWSNGQTRSTRACVPKILGPHTRAPSRRKMRPICCLRAEGSQRVGSTRAKPRLPERWERREGHRWLLFRPARSP